MKDYSMNEEERKYFIKKYKKDGKGNIITYFANRIKHVSSDNEHNKAIIIKKMEEQVKGSDECLKKYGYRKYVSKFLSIVFVCACVVTGALLGLFVPADNVALVMTNGLFFTSGIGSLISTGVYIDAKIILNDLEKNRHFIKIKDKINGNVRKENMLVGTSKKTRNKVQEIPLEEEVFDINNFNNIPQKDFNVILGNIDREKKFAFVYDGQPNNENGYIATTGRAKTKTRTQEIRD